MDWVPLPLDKALFANLDPDAVVGHLTGLENGYINELGGLTRFPGLVPRVTLDNKARIRGLNDFEGDLVAINDLGQVYRIDKSYTATNVTAVAVEGGRRPIFAKTANDLLAAAGGPIVRLRYMQTELLSADAPEASHIAFIDNFVIAVEINSGRFFHSTAGDPDVWDALDVFAADGNPDNISALMITPFRELLLYGPESTEQFDRLPTGDVPFFRRWAIGDGLKAPYALVFADNASWMINGMTEFVRASGQSAEARSGEIGRLLESFDDWTDAWIGGYPDRPLHILGQKFILLQLPNATNGYGTQGVTLVYDYRHKRWFELYGWDSVNQIPARYPIWSHWRLWDKVFCGGNGVIYEMTDTTHAIAGATQRWLVRTAHAALGHMACINNLRLQVRRGIGGNATSSKIQVRCSRDGRPFGPWNTRDLGVAGDRIQFKEFGSFGTATTFRFEIACTDDCPVDLIKAEVAVDRVGHGS